jgi:FdhD protein
LSESSDGAAVLHFHYFDGHRDGGLHDIEAEVIAEGFVTIFINGRELATLMCTPRDPLQLVFGFLANEGFIQSLAEVELAHLCQAETCADLWLSHQVWDQPRRRVITSGCSGGLTFADLAGEQPPVPNSSSFDPNQLGILLSQLQGKESLYTRARGVHTSALSDGEHLLMVTEDIGRHNTLDRLRGECLRQNRDPAGLILLTTGRVSSEMIFKAAQMRCPIVASRTSPTSLSVQLAQSWNITLCGYVHKDRMNIYTHPERLNNSDR